MIHYSKVEMQNRMIVIIHYIVVQCSEINSIKLKLDIFRIFHLQIIHSII